jgi:hypothetical protein
MQIAADMAISLTADAERRGAVSPAGAPWLALC